MNRIMIEQRRVKIRKQKQIQFEILICDDYSEGTIDIRDIAEDKEQKERFYDDNIILITDLLKVYYQDGYGDSITSIFDRLIENESPVRIDDEYYDYEELKDIIKQVEAECV
jgi:hypothetical protein